MKKIFVILFSFFYLVIASGFTTYTHICKGLVQQTSMNTTLSSEGSCGFCSKTKISTSKTQENCCKEKVEVVKIKSDVKASSFKVIKLNPLSDAIFHRYIGAVFDTTTIKQIPTIFFGLYHFKAKDIPLYIKYCVYRI